MARAFCIVSSGGRLPDDRLPPEGGSHEWRDEATKIGGKPRVVGGSHEIIGRRDREWFNEIGRSATC